jgi:hypothetical protein
MPLFPCWRMPAVIPISQPVFQGPYRLKGPIHRRVFIKPDLLWNFMLYKILPMKTIHRCLECGQPLSRGVHEFSRRLYGHSLCMKDQYLLGESGATAETIDLYLALKSRRFPLVLDYFDGHKQVDIALPGKLYIEIYHPDQQAPRQAVNNLVQSVYTLEKKIPTIMISHAMLGNPVTFARLVEELSKACGAMLKAYEFSVSCAPPFTAAQLQ